MAVSDGCGRVVAESAQSRVSLVRVRPIASVAEGPTYLNPDLSPPVVLSPLLFAAGVAGAFSEASSQPASSPARVPPEKRMPRDDAAPPAPSSPEDDDAVAEAPSAGLRGG